MIHLHRRSFLTLLGTSAAAWPLAARAQQQIVHVIGYLSGGSRDTDGPRLVVFHQGLAETRYVEGRNLAVEYRWADGRNERIPALVADLVRRQVAVITGVSTTAAV